MGRKSGLLMLVAITCRFVPGHAVALRATHAPIVVQLPISNTACEIPGQLFQGGIQGQQFSFKLGCEKNYCSCEFDTAKKTEDSRVKVTFDYDDNDKSRNRLKTVKSVKIKVPGQDMELKRATFDTNNMVFEPSDTLARQPMWTFKLIGVNGDILGECERSAPNIRRHVALRIHMSFEDYMDLKRNVSNKNWPFPQLMCIVKESGKWWKLRSPKADEEDLTESPNDVGVKTVKLESQESEQLVRVGTPRHGEGVRVGNWIRPIFFMKDIKKVEVHVKYMSVDRTREFVPTV